MTGIGMEANICENPSTRGHMASLCHKAGPLGAKRLMEIYGRLLEHFGPQHWWPGDSPLEVMVGAVLTQNTAWPNVEKAIDALKAHCALSMDGLIRISEQRLAELIRPCGYFRVKAKRLKNLVNRVEAQCAGDLSLFLALPTGELQEALLAVSGIGPETADSILLYGARRPVFVVDAYTRRALSRHAWISPKAKYREIQALFMDRLRRDAALYNEYHALWVALGKTHCRPKARCAGCPLETYLTEAEG